LEIVLLRPGDDIFKLPVFVSEVVLNGYVPRLGEDVQGGFCRISHADMQLGQLYRASRVAGRN
jgi:hypothetical protein